MKLTINRALKSPNTWQGRHWRVKHRESQTWEWDIAASLLTDAGKRHGGIWALLIASNSIPPKRTCEERRKVTVTRIVPSARNFIRDDDNLRFSVKPLLDALKRLGLIKNDSRKWLEHPTPTQEVSMHKQWATVIEIEKVQ